MNTLVLAEVTAKKASQASMLFSASQQLGSSFGVGTAVLLLGVLAIILLLAAAAFGRLNETAG